MCTIADITTDNCANVPGILKQIILIDAIEITGMPTFDPDTGLASGDITVNTPISGSNFKLIDIVEDDSMIDVEQLGSRDARHFKHSLTARIKGFSPTVAATLASASAVPLIVLAVTNMGVRYILGTLENPCYFSTQAGTTGKTGSTDRAGFTVKLEAVGQQYYPMKYSGAIT